MPKSKINPKSFDYSEIIENFLFIGSHQSSKNLEGLKAIKITHILSLAGKCQFPSEFIYGTFHLKDGSTSEEINEKFPEICEFIENARQNSRNRVFVHCRAGLSRSPFIVIKYLMKHFGFSLNDAFESVQKSRPQIRMHEYYCHDLIQMDIANSCYLEKILNRKTSVLK